MSHLFLGILLQTAEYHGPWENGIQGWALQQAQALFLEEKGGTVLEPQKSMWGGPLGHWLWTGWDYKMMTKMQMLQSREENKGITGQVLLGDVILIPREKKL